MEADEFEMFVRQSTPALRRYARAVAADFDQAEDLLQETYVRMAGAWHRLLTEGNPIGYAKTVMVRLHISWMRTLVRRARIVAPVRPLVADGGLGRVDDHDQLRRMLADLPPLQRVVLVLSYLDDMTDEAIAEAIGRRPATVRSLRHRALGAIRAGLPTHAGADRKVAG
ncbi:MULTISPECIES: SigE family RNA polymerase sigma factor [Micromonospora]|uniref:SigE family RNA polymerase sigma factor n=1 Tax=Micromonospora TaxID=1873 RepID=UPI000F85DCFF|nr:SigE family RNA polymerase sigma factor [Verrucosispora sp. FIM060022]RUL91437.1 SigE family RNA polymerase sigma factor [Verrucosispora sp. FIM060022]